MADLVFDPDDFPEDLYLEEFPDVRAGVAAGLFRSGYDHWLTHGRAEIANGLRHSPFAVAAPEPEPAAAATVAVPRSPAPILLTASPDSPPYQPPEPEQHPPVAPAPFIEELYLAVNPDVAEGVARGTISSARQHWEEAGREEERAGLRPSLPRDMFYPSPPPAAPEPDVTGFDPDSYLALYPDVRRAVGGNRAEALSHWLDHGRAEGRTAPGIAPFGFVRANIGAMLAKPFGVNLFGPFAASTGLGTAARGILEAVQSAGLQFAVHAFDVSHGPPRVTAAERERKPRFRVNLILANADQMARLAAAYPPDTFQDAYNIAVWAWELAAFRPDWFASFAPLDEVWTNSEFELESIAAVAPIPVHKLRLPVRAIPASAREGRDLFGIPHDRLVFLVAFDVGSTSARKNPRMVVEAFREAFQAGANVFLVIKFHSNAFEPQMTRELTQALRGADNVLVVADRLSEHDMALLQAACDCFVSAHRSEGFGLNLAEFMALGKPVIATGYSGNLEFFDESTGFPVGYTLREIETQAGPYMPGYVWAEPSREDLIRQLRAVHDDQTAAWARGRAAAARMREEFTVERIGQQIRDRLLSMGLTVQLPPFLTWYGSARALRGPAPMAGIAEAQRQAMEALGDGPPVISVVVPVYNVAPAWLEACIRSVQAQTYRLWELCLCDDASTDPATRAVLDRFQGTDPRIRIRRLPRNLGIAGATNAAIEMATGSYVAFLDNDDTIEPDALFEVARAIVSDATIDCLYTDEDKIDEQGRLLDTFFKPDWSPEHLESVMYVLHMLVVRKKLLLELGGLRPEYAGAQDYELMLRVSRRTQRIHHIKRALYHWRAIAGSAATQVDAKPWALHAGFRAVQEHAVLKYGPEARVENGLLPGTFRVRRPIHGTPRVTLIILTNNARIELPDRPSFAMVDNLVDSILRRTAYPNYEILVVDNSRLLEEQVARFRALGVRVENYARPVVPFNYAAKTNYALRLCRTEQLVLLNDDMEVINDDWLHALLELSGDPEIGAVGARLLHADGSIQHVGQVIGVNGGAAHVYHCFPGEFIGYNGFTHLIRNYSAVTAACLATRKSVLAQVGGLDESFAVDYNDTDLCLKIIEAGYRIAYTPYASLYHFEGASAQRHAADPQEVQRFARRWARFMEDDPYYNPNLARDRHDFALRE